MSVVPTPEPEPSDSDLLSIGQFARLSGLSVGALRHYDEVGLLTPAEVDGTTSYRRYRRSQLESARLAAVLRELEMPLEEVRGVLASDDPRTRRQLLVRHRARVEARAARLGRIVHHLIHLIDPDHVPLEEAMPVPDDALDPQSQRALASALFNRVWELLEKSDRSRSEDDEMVNAAHASRYLWGGVGDRKNFAIGDWQISRVYSVVGRGEPAVHHARRCLDHAGEVEGEPWLLASAYEALARAYAVGGDRAAAEEWKIKAEQRLEQVTDPDDREIVARDIRTLPV